MENLMDGEKFTMSMALIFREVLFKEKHNVKTDYLYILMDQFIEDKLLIQWRLVKENLYMEMISLFIKENGLMISLMV
jgi:hypothetical protein